MNTIKDFEKYVIEKEDFNFDYSFELILFVDKLNEYIVRYYQNCLYSHILKKRLEKLHGKQISDEKYDKLIEYDYNGLLIFPSIGTNIKKNSYINSLMLELHKFINKVDFYSLQYLDVINFATNKKIHPILNYEDCVRAARELAEMKKRNIFSYILNLQNQLNNQNYSFLFELHDFMDRFENFYIMNGDIECADKIKGFKKEIKSLY